MHKHKIISLTFAVLCVLMTTVAPVLAQEDPPQSDGQFIWNDDYTLEAGERVEGDLVVFNGDVVLKDGSSVEGSVVVWNGNADVDGRIDGELVVSNGDIALKDDARIDGNVVCSWSCDIEQNEGARVGGSIIENAPLGDSQFATGDRIHIPIPGVPRVTFWGSAPGQALGWVFKAFRGIASVLVMAVIGGLVALMWPGPTERVGRTVTEQPLPSLGIGLLASAAATVLIIALAITICLSPIALLGMLLLGAAVLFGWISLGALLGERLLKALKAEEVAPLWAAALGTLILTAVTGGLSSFFCLAPLGWLASFLLGTAGLGAVALTRFGTMQYASTGEQVAAAESVADPEREADVWEVEAPEEPMVVEMPEEPDVAEEV